MTAPDDLADARRLRVLREILANSDDPYFAELTAIADLLIDEAVDTDAARRSHPAFKPATARIGADTTTPRPERALR